MNAPKPRTIILTDYLLTHELNVISVLLAEHATSSDDHLLQRCIAQYLVGTEQHDENVADDLAYAIVFDAKRTLPEGPFATVVTVEHGGL